MSTAQHTPGPWKVGGEWPKSIVIYHQCYPLVHVRNERDSHWLATCETGNHTEWIGKNPIGNEIAKANARLIAAAPDLLAALKLAKSILARECQVPEEECVGGDFVTINAAIAKATSEASP